jgi:hypothetical protein
MMHNESIDYNSQKLIQQDMEDFLLDLIDANIRGFILGRPRIVKRDTDVDAANNNRQKCMQMLNTQRMSVMYSSSNFIHYFILYRMDDGRIADIYMKLTADKKVDVFECTICVEH